MKINKIIAQYIIDYQKNKPIIIAFDGVDTSGKTVMANNVYKILKDNNKNAVRVSYSSCISMWGLDDHNSWLSAGNPCLFDRYLTPKKAINAVFNPE